MKKHWFS